MSGSSRSAARSARLKLSVCVHFALVDQAALVLVHELDRVLDRDDVVAARAIDVIDHRAQRRRLARPGRPGDEHQPLVQVAQVEHRRREAELLGRQDLRRDDAEDGAGSLAIEEQVGAEAGESLDLVGEVGVVAARELVLVRLRNDGIEERDHFRRRDRPGVGLERLDLAVLADERRHVRRQVEVGCLRIDHQPGTAVDGRGAERNGRGCDGATAAAGATGAGEGRV